MDRKRGQAAMEFLMTYGWAILAAVLAIGVLAYFGVFSPESSLPPVCNIPAPLGCGEYMANDTGVRIIMPNGAGSPVTITNFTVIGCNETNYGSLADGAVADVFFTCPASTTVGSRFNGEISVTYTPAGKTIARTVTGKIRVPVE